MALGKMMVPASIVLAVVLLVMPLLTALISTPGTRLNATGVELVVDNPAGAAAVLNTTAVAGYYCVRAFPSSGWSIMLNAYLPNSVVVQDIMLSVTPIPTLLTSFYDSNVWSADTNPVLLHARQTVPAFTCGWLVIALEGGEVYIGYSPDGEHVIWFDRYHTGGGSIIAASMLLGGVEEGQADTGGRTTAFLALYYWSGSSWAPARLIIADSGVLESVDHAWVSVSSECGAVVSWPNPTSEVPCPSQPSFKP
ncbi:MAG: hypothetical protein RQ842_01655 [Vulcanisaeta sp.]|nr:hypothetical protein [Vulcanisaeta sp.]